MDKRVKYKFSEDGMSVAEFYAGKSVLITGTSGFIGKIILEKLLYSCPDVNKIFVLMRDKRGEVTEQRFRKLIDSPVFSRLKAERPEDLSKIVVVSGELTVPNLAMNRHDLDLILEEVSIVIHSAAIVNFKYSFENVYKTNVEGTRNDLELCNKLKKRHAFVYLSTAFAHIDKQLMEEKVYPPPADIDHIEQLLATGDEIDEQTTRRIIKNSLNSYTFLKALTESMIERDHGDTPSVIVRPSIVISTYKEPFSGWQESWSGITMLLNATTVGLLRVVLGKGDYIGDIIPADYVANLTIVAAAKGKAIRTEEVAVYNCCSSSVNPISWADLQKLYLQSRRVAEPDNNSIVRMNLMFINSKLLVYLTSLCLQVIPAYFTDLVLKIQGKPAKYVKIVEKIIELRLSVEELISKNCVWPADNALTLSNSLSEQDRQLFPFDPTDMNWIELISDYERGVSKYLIQNSKL